MKKLLFLVFVFLFFLQTTPVLALDEFETNYNIHYQVSQSGKVNVVSQISLTNKLSSVYATKYSLIIKGTQIENIQASDELGPLKTEIFRNNEETTIIFTFNQEVVGSGKILNFKLSYDAWGVAQKNGQIWEINIPRLSEKNLPDNYTLTLSVPTNFGNPAYIRPNPVERIQKEGFNLYRFTKNQILTSGVNAAFGQFQIFDFNLSYHLENPHSDIAKTEIALPPDTAFQQVYYQKIDPLPLDIKVDEDGNWLAKYKLGPNQRVNISVLGKVKIFAHPQERFPKPTQEVLEKNLLPKKYWEVDNVSIQEKAKTLKTPKAIYDFVVKTLDYDFNRVKEGAERFGAVKALENPRQAICMEFSDLFVALARAGGIPSREISGFAYTTNEKIRPLGLVADVLHSWPEYWDNEQKIWRPVDPTWEKTTGGVDYFSKTDLNHFAFVIHGQNSQMPYPAGSYKTNYASNKDVEIVFGEYEEDWVSKLAVDFNLPKKVFWGIKNKGKIVIKNIGSLALYDAEIKIEAEGINVALSDPSKTNLSILPPFKNEEIEVELKPSAFFKPTWGKINLWINDQYFSYLIKTDFLLPMVSSLAILILVLTLVILLTKQIFYAKKRQ